MFKPPHCGDARLPCSPLRRYTALKLPGLCRPPALVHIGDSLHSGIDGGFHRHGGTPKWLVYSGWEPIEMDDGMWYPHCTKPPHPPYNFGETDIIRNGNCRTARNWLAKIRDNWINWAWWNSPNPTVNILRGQIIGTSPSAVVALGSKVNQHTWGSPCNKCEFWQLDSHMFGLWALSGL